MDSKCEDTLKQVVRNHGGRWTGERLLLLQTVCKMQGHFEAEEVRVAAAKAGHKLSLSTVYRNLDLIAEAGIIRRVSFISGISGNPNDKKRMKYEAVWDKKHHDHLICVGCGKTLEFSYPAIEVLQDAVATSHDFVLVGHHLELLGFCKKCREQADVNELRLRDIAPKSEVRVTRLTGAGNVTARIRNFGVSEGKRFKVLRFAPLGGPVLLEDHSNGAKIMISRSLASNVFVEMINAE